MSSGLDRVFSALARQNAYANDMLFQEASKLSLEELIGTKSPSRNSAYQLLVHLLAAEGNYWGQICGERRRNVNQVAATSITEIVSVAAEHNEGFLKFVTSLTDDDFGRAVTFEFSNGSRLVYPVWQLLTQTYLHSMQHRGELSILLSELGHPLPIDDIIVRFTEESGQPWPFAGK